MDLFTWETAYRVPRAGTILVFPVYELKFEDTVLASCLDKEKLDKMAAMLNGAYNLGRSAGHMESKFNNKENGNGHT